MHLNAVNMFGESVADADPPVHRMSVHDQVDLPAQVGGQTRIRG
jgi:hypothetical protein